VPTNNAEQVREFYRKQGEERERERIVKLLETNDHYSVDWLIELIKGESK
jgi:hypothetical protein